MNNLKRVLSLALSGIMLVGMMSVGASAAGFTDADKISNTDAVNTLVSLGVINGKDDGSFAPEETVTRSQMAKMITVALNGGKDFTYGTKVTPTYSDIKGHWAESYIEYCSSLNIIAGQGDGTFNPDAPVTGSAAAKMMLVAIGYDAAEENLVGIDWEVNTNRIADNNGLYQDLSSLNPSAPLSRDNAAQVIFNACDAKMVEYDYKLVTENGNLATKGVAKEYADGRTLFSNKFSLVEGTGMLQKVDYNKDDKEFTYTVKEAVDGSPKTDLEFKSETDYTALYGMNVKVLYKTSSTGKVTAYGMFDDGALTVVATKADVTDVKAAEDEMKISGTKYTLAKKAEETPVYVAPNGADFAATDKFLNDVMDDVNTSEASALIFVGEDNSKIDYVVLIPASVEEVTFVGSSTVTTKGGSYDLEDDVVAEGLKKGDFVKSVKAEHSVYGVNTVTKLDTVTGTVDAKRDGETKVDGTWYNNAEGLEELALGEEYDLYVIGKTIFAYEQITESATMDDVLLFLDGGEVRYGVSEGRAYFTDGTNSIVKVAKVDGEELSKGDTVADGLYTYKVKNGEYQLTTVDGDNTVGNYDYNADQTGVKDEKIGTYYIADDAVVFAVKKNGTTAKIYKGTDVQDWAEITGATIKLLSKDVKGMDTVQLAYITLATENAEWPSKVGDGKWGFVLTKPETVKKDDETYASYSIWTEDGEIDVLDEDADSTAAKKGEVIAFTDNGDGTIADAEIVSTDANAFALRGLNGDNIRLIAMNGTENTDITSKDKDTVILYVNTKDDKGVEGGELDVAAEYKDGQYLINVWVVRRGETKKADLIVYDITGDIDNYDNDDKGVTAGSKTEEHGACTFEQKGTDKAATCTEAGSVSYYECTNTKGVCPNEGKKFSDNKGTTEVKDADLTIAAKGHQNTSWSTADAAGDGYAATDHIKTCADCSAVIDHHTAAEHDSAGSDCNQ